MGRNLLFLSAVFFWMCSLATHTSTESETTSSPTVSPTTVSPTTLSPTLSPTTSPTASPTTPSPTVSPTTLSPTILSPTVSPTYIYYARCTEFVQWDGTSTQYADCDMVTGKCGSSSCPVGNSDILCPGTQCPWEQYAGVPICEPYIPTCTGMKCLGRVGGDGAECITQEEKFRLCQLCGDIPAPTTGSPTSNPTMGPLPTPPGNTQSVTIGRNDESSVVVGVNEPSSTITVTVPAEIFDVAADGTTVVSVTAIPTTVHEGSLNSTADNEGGAFSPIGPAVVSVVAMVDGVSLAAGAVTNLTTPIEIIFSSDVGQSSTCSSGSDPVTVESSAYTCGWWDPNAGEWTQSGCITEEASADTIRCLCDHLTDFALLLEASSVEGCLAISDLGIQDYLLFAVYGSIVAFCGCVAVVLIDVYKRRRRSDPLKKRTAVLLCNYLLVMACAASRLASIWALSGQRHSDYFFSHLVALACPYLLEIQCFSRVLQTWVAICHFSMQSADKSWASVRPYVLGIDCIASLAVLSIFLWFLLSPSPTAAVTGSITLALLLLVLAGLFLYYSQNLLRFLDKGCTSSTPSSSPSSPRRSSRSSRSWKIRLLGCLLPLSFALQAIVSLVAVFQHGETLAHLTIVFLVSNCIALIVMLIAFWAGVRSVMSFGQTMSSTFGTVNTSMRRARSGTDLHMVSTHSMPQVPKRESQHNISSTHGTPPIPK